MQTLNGAPMGERFIAVLGSAVTSRITLRLPGIAVRIAGPDFRDVAAAIQDHRILVTCSFRDNPDTRSKYGFYFTGRNAFVFHNPAFPSNQHENALLIHEAVHAILDMRRLSLLRLNVEVYAYIVQLAWLILANEGGWDTLDPARAANARGINIDNCVAGRGDRSCQDALFLAAFAVARSLLAGDPPPEPALEDLYRAIPRHELYQNEDMMQVTHLDGVPDPVWRR